MIYGALRITINHNVNAVIGQDDSDGRIFTIVRIAQLKSDCELWAHTSRAAIQDCPLDCTKVDLACMISHAEYKDSICVFAGPHDIPRFQTMLGL